MSGESAPDVLSEREAAADGDALSNPIQNARIQILQNRVGWMLVCAAALRCTHTWARLATLARTATGVKKTVRADILPIYMLACGAGVCARKGVGDVACAVL
jgi:hypothetical protein